MKMTGNKPEWFAARAIRERSYVLRYLELEGLETARIADIPSLLFLHCTRKRVERLRPCLWDRVLFYTDPGRVSVQPIPDRTMETFLRLAPRHDEPIMYVPVYDPRLFDGQPKRVKSGIFAGCEGVVKRYKGSRRLIIRLSDTAAIATSYIPEELLEDI